uniref:Uncharacterized protein n=1 Tax=Brassica oleracea var. oleracea TaxID=109376 RepID=A0A0D3BVK7_BRAOL
MTVGEHDGESPEASQRTAELPKQIDSPQGQITDIHRTQGTTGENSNLSSEVQSLKEKLDEHSAKRREAQPATVREHCPPTPKSNPQRGR